MSTLPVQYHWPHSAQKEHRECLQGVGSSCLAHMMAQEPHTGAQVIDNVIAAAFGNASAGPTAAKCFQHLAAGDW